MGEGIEDDRSNGIKQCQPRFCWTIWKRNPVYVVETFRLSRSVKGFCDILETIQKKHLRLVILGSITVDCREGQVNRQETHDQEDIPAVFYKHYPSYVSGNMNLSELVRVCRLSRPTVYKYLARRVKKIIKGFRVGLWEICAKTFKEKRIRLVRR